MFRKIYLLSALLLSVCTMTAQDYSKLNILPQPVQVSVGNQNSRFIFTPQTTIVYNFNDYSTKRAIEELQEIALEVFGKKIKTATKVSGDNNIILKKNDSLAEEEYVLEITPENIIINARSAAGTFYAVQTLKQIIPVQVYETPIDLQKLPLPLLKISDKPHFAYRGFMLDCSRHFWSVETIKELLDILALHKMNRFHWHLTEDQGWRIEIKKYPLLTEIGSLREQTTTGRNVGMDGIPYGGYYTQKEIKEIVKYAQDRFITIIPEIEIPGHSLGALSAYPWLGCRGEEGNYKTWSNWGVSPQIACAGKESTFKFWEDVLSEVAELFPGEYIHIGGDEAPRDEWKVCPKCQQRIKDEGLHNEAELQSYVTNRVEKFLNSKGKKLIGWDEILEGGVSQSATIMAWRGADRGIEAAKKGN